MSTFRNIFVTAAAFISIANSAGAANPQYEELSQKRRGFDTLIAASLLPNCLSESAKASAIRSLSPNVLPEMWTCVNAATIYGIATFGTEEQRLRLESMLDLAASLKRSTPRFYGLANHMSLMTLLLKLGNEDVTERARLTEIVANIQTAATGAEIIAAIRATPRNTSDDSKFNKLQTWLSERAADEREVNSGHANLRVKEARYNLGLDCRAKDGILEITLPGYNFRSTQPPGDIHLPSEGSE
ncbi:MAG: hypothetical protein ABL958_11050 [Bdellovibrionia bacterium]